MSRADYSDHDHHDEFLQRAPWPDVQSSLLAAAIAQLRRVFEVSPYYHRKLSAAGIDPAKITSAGQFARVPFFDKDEERRSQEADPPFGGHLCVPRDQLARVYASSGTTGTPTFFGLTAADLRTWRRLMARTFAVAGVRPGDVYGALGNFSMFVGGIPSLDAATEAGAMTVPIGVNAGTERTLELMRRLGVTVIGATPSFAVHLAEAAEKRFGAPAWALGLRLMLVGGEPGGQIPALRAQISDSWHCQIRDVMGVGEFAGTIWAESSDEAGMHFCALRELYVELIDPVSGELRPFGDGAEGELVYTAVQREASPLIRFRSRDHVRVSMSPTPSGRTAPRIITLGRTDDMLIVRGVNVFPSAVRDVAASFVPLTTGHIQIVLERPGPLVSPPLAVEVEVSDGVPADRQGQVSERLRTALRDRLHVNCDIRLVAAGALPRTATKTQYVRRGWEQ